MDTYPKTDRTTSLREKERMSYSREQAHAILDEAWFCTLSFIHDNEPRALPTLYVRVDDTLHPVLNLASARLVTGSDARPEIVDAAEIDKAKRPA